jgi:hypothetical protein
VNEARGDRAEDRGCQAATSASPTAHTRSINLDYLDPAEVDPMAWAADPDTLVVPDAGEDLYRLR